MLKCLDVVYENSRHERVSRIDGRSVGRKCCGGKILSAFGAFCVFYVSGRTIIHSSLVDSLPISLMRGLAPLLEQCLLHTLVANDTPVSCRSIH